jgi:uncharacterized membrane protein
LKAKFSANGTRTATAAGSSLQSNVAGSLCYLLGFLTGVFFLVVDPYKRDHFVRFHAFQAIFLSVACLAAFFILFVILTMAPGFFWGVIWWLYPALSVGLFLLWLVLMHKAHNREQFRLPIIGDLAARQA